MSQFSNKVCRVLVFNPLKRLIAIFKSTASAAKAFNTRSNSIHYACTGVCISCQNYYFRYLQDDIEISLDDLGTLKLEEYDELCGIERKVYRTKKMNRTGMKYKKKQNSTQK